MNVCSECKYRNPCEQLNYLDVANTCSDLREFVDEIRADVIEDFKKELIEIYNKRYMHDIYLDDIDDIVERLSR